MTNSRRILLLSALVFPGLCLLAAPPATAQGVPDPRLSTVDPVVVGNATGTPMGGTPPGFDVVVRDVNNDPVPGHVVTLRFGDSGMRLISVQNSGTTLDCAARSISRVTNASGAVNFAARVGGFDNANVIEVLDNSVRLAMVKGRSTDLDGLDGRTTLGDLVIFASNFPGNAQETDFDLNGMTGLGDFVLFSSEYNQGPTQQPYCP
jgi:hypothetical protein